MEDNSSDMNKLMTELHHKTHNMTSTKAGFWTRDKVKELGEYLVSLSENDTLSHEDIVSYVDRVNALVDNYSSKVHSDAGWEFENSRFR